MAKDDSAKPVEVPGDGQFPGEQQRDKDGNTPAPDGAEAPQAEAAAKAADSK